MREVYPVLTDIEVASKSITSLGKLRPHSSTLLYTLPTHVIMTRSETFCIETCRSNVSHCPLGYSGFIESCSL